ncbi:MAG: succinyl-diaminopimelate desuccinylase [Pseudomonadota bacterium]
MTGTLNPVSLAQDLIRCPSITPIEGGALDLLQGLLEPLGFVCHRRVFQTAETAPVDNLYARWGREGENHCFAGHTDVVPPGDPADWQVDPFSATLRDGLLIGRGAVDMKGAIAAYVAALAGLLEQRKPKTSFSLLITGDEEGPSINGTVKMLGALPELGEKLDSCLVGEPTSVTRIGDMAKIGRRGSLNGWLTVTGKQGHSAYPHLADNPAHRLIALLQRLTQEPLDQGNAHFQASNLQVTTIDIANPATNVIPATASARFNVRFNDLHHSSDIEAWVRERMAAVGGEIDLKIRVSGESFLTPPGPLSARVCDAVEAVTGAAPELSTTGGTSDARFIRTACPTIELGLRNEWAHKVDEQVPLTDIESLTQIYGRYLDSLAA